VTFQDRPWDLYVVMVYTVTAAALLLALGVGSVLAILLVLFVPGYVVVAALFPAEQAVTWVERLALSIGVTIAVVPLLGLLLNFTPWGIRFVPIVATITLFTLGAGTAAYWRRIRLPPDHRLSLTVDLAVPDWNGYSTSDKGLTLALVASIVVAGGTLAYVVLTPRPGEAFTEFYLLGPTGNFSGYPTTLNRSQEGSVIIGIGNHEAVNVNYTVRIDLVGIRILYNMTSGLNETVEVNRTTWSTLPIPLANGGSWTQSYTFRINYTGFWKVQFLLFKGWDFSSSYRELHIYTRVF